jgi:peroxiredoxin
VREVLQLQPELPELKEQGMDFYVVTAGSERELRAFFDRIDLEATIIWDKDLSIFRTYEVVGIPASYFIDKKGRIRDQRLGWTSSSLGEFKDIVKLLCEEE